MLKIFFIVTDNFQIWGMTRLFLILENSAGKERRENAFFVARNQYTLRRNPVITMRLQFK